MPLGQKQQANIIFLPFKNSFLPSGVFMSSFFFIFPSPAKQSVFFQQIVDDILGIQLASLLYASTRYAYMMDSHTSFFSLLLLV
jgi:hypothetical protein